MKLFGNTVKFLLAQRGLTAKELAERVNLSETSVSKIVKGITKPRQANLTRIIQELCATPDEEQQLISAYEQIEETVSEEPRQLSKEVFEDLEEARVRRYLQAKSHSIAFREQVAKVLTQSGIFFQGPHQNEDVICDFFIPGPPRTAIECKANPKRDWDRTLTSANLFLTELPSDCVIIVVPDDAKASEIKKAKQNFSGKILKLSKLKGALG